MTPSDEIKIVIIELSQLFTTVVSLDLRFPGEFQPIEHLLKNAIEDLVELQNKMCPSLSRADSAASPSTLGSNILLIKTATSKIWHIGNDGFQGYYVSFCDPRRIRGPTVRLDSVMNPTICRRCIRLKTKEGR